MRGIIAGMPAIPAIPLSQARPGDIVLCHEQGFLAKAIRFGQRLRVPWMYAEWNHCAVLNARVTRGWSTKLRLVALPSSLLHPWVSTSSSRLTRSLPSTAR